MTNGRLAGSSVCQNDCRSVIDAAFDSIYDRLSGCADALRKGE